MNVVILAHGCTLNAPLTIFSYHELVTDVPFLASNAREGGGGEEMVPRSMTGMGSQPIQLSSRIRGIGGGVGGERVWGSDCPRVGRVGTAMKSRGWVWSLGKC